MSFVISLVLACTTLLATFMLQLCDDSPKSNGSLISAISFFAVLGALYFVDYKKKFSLSRTWTNVLLIVVVCAQFGTLIQSRNDFLAFSIANVLSSLQIVLFFQRKTLRKSYQILTISFVEIAVGCVFQRSALFVAALPVYATFAFITLALLFMWGERKFYAERVVAKNRFSGNKTLDLFTAEEKNSSCEKESTDVIDSGGAYRYGKSAALTDEARFFRRHAIKPIDFNFEFFRRFVVGSLGACLFAGVFFCLFPRWDQIGFGQIQFDPVSWQNARGGKTTRTGFKPSIELGDLGPAVDSHEPVMNVSVKDLLDLKTKQPLDVYSPVYFRGLSLANYSDGVWSDVQTRNIYSNAKDLCDAIRKTSITDPESVVSAKVIDADKVSEEVQFIPRPSSREPRRGNGNSPPPGQFRSPSNGPDFYNVPERVKTRNNDYFFKTPLFHQPPAALPIGLGPGVSDWSDPQIEEGLIDFAEKYKDTVQYDLRSQLLSMQINLHRLDTLLVFSTYPSFIVKTSVPLGTNQSLGVQMNVDPRERRSMNELWFLTTAFLDGRQMEITPNQERVYCYLDQYLAIDETKFPGLIATAKRWDDESNIPKDDFVSRARNIVSHLRDLGEYKYNRTGVLRNQEIDPLEDFVLEHKEGHCEYFAGALTLLLRAIGIPARVVVGYACYPTENGASMIVRQSDAHSWVEAYIPSEKLPTKESPSAYLYPGANYQNETETFIPKRTEAWTQDGAWLRLDATPSADRDAERPNAVALGVYNWSYYIKSLGNDFVLNFNGARQMQNIYRPIVNLWKSVISGLKQLTNNFSFVKDIVKSSVETVKSFLLGEWTSEVIVRFFFLISGLALILYLLLGPLEKIIGRLKRSIKGVQELKRKRDALKNRDEISAELYRRVQASLELQHKTRREISETPREFVKRCFRLEDEQIKAQTATPETAAADGPRVTSPQDREKILQLVERYYSAQYGGDFMTPEESTRWSDTLALV